MNNNVPDNKVINTLRKINKSGVESLDLKKEETFLCVQKLIDIGNKLEDLVITDGEK